MTVVASSEGAQTSSFREGLRITAPAGLAYALCVQCGNVRLVDADAKPLCMHRGNQVAWQPHDGFDWAPMHRVNELEAS